MSRIGLITALLFFSVWPVAACCALRASAQQPASAPPFSTRCRAVRFHVRGVDHLRVGGSSVPGKLSEQVFPDAASRPAHKAVIDRCRRPIVGRAIAPATAALQHVYDGADQAPGFDGRKGFVE
jgi:hypothetical protein